MKFKKMKNFLSTFDFRLSTTGGYSLVEMLVAVAIFTIVAMVSISALISINDANKKAQTMRAIIDNLNFATENMARNLRVGTTYHCDYTNLLAPLSQPLDCASSGAGSIAFEAYNGDSANPNDQVVYSLNSNGQIMKSVNSGGTFLPLTPYNGELAPELQPLTIDYLRFYVTGALPGDNLQPRVVIVIGGTARYSSQIQTKFQIQTSVSERRIDS